MLRFLDIAKITVSYLMLERRLAGPLSHACSPSPWFKLLVMPLVGARFHETIFPEMLYGIAFTVDIILINVKLFVSKCISSDK